MIQNNFLGFTSLEKYKVDELKQNDTPSNVTFFCDTNCTASYFLA
jgi:hypothetical protein